MFRYLCHLDLLPVLLDLLKFLVLEIALIGNGYVNDHKKLS